MNMIIGCENLSGEVSSGLYLLSDFVKFYPRKHRIRSRGQCKTISKQDFGAQGNADVTFEDNHHKIFRKLLNNTNPISHTNTLLSLTTISGQMEHQTTCFVGLRKEIPAKGDMPYEPTSFIVLFSYIAITHACLYRRLCTFRSLLEISLKRSSFKFSIAVKGDIE